MLLLIKKYMNKFFISFIFECGKTILLFLLGFLVLSEKISYADLKKESPKLNEEKDILMISEQFRNLRAIKGHFEGGAWNKKVDSWHSEKHLALMQLAAYAEVEQLSQTELETLLGKADKMGEKKNFPSSFWEQIEWINVEDVNASDFFENQLVMVYHLRGQHDQCVFYFLKGRVKGYGWLFAYE